jgi:transposase
MSRSDAGTFKTRIIFTKIIGNLLKVFEFLEANPTVHIHYTPTYSSWLNQVEIWFSKIQRDVISRGVFSSVKDLARKLMRYIRNYNKTATPIRWIYKNVGHRIAPAAI